MYSNGSGQRINFNKSSILFSNHYPDQIRQRAKNGLDTHNEAFLSTYLGMPSWVGRSISNTFNFLADRIWKKIRGWCDRPLSRAGREVMLKSVAQAIPTYVMSCFHLPPRVCNRLRSIISDHWWGFEDGRKKMHWRS